MLTVCTANMCRSPLLEVLLEAELRARGVDARVGSCGTAADGRGAVPEMVKAAERRGLDLRSHVGRRLDGALVADADLVLPLTREHLREVVVVRPDAFPRTFTPKELVRRAGETAPRGADEALGDYLARLHEGRSPQQMLRPDPADDVDDPIGGPRSGYERTAAELEGLAAALADLLAPPGAELSPLTTTSHQER